MKFSELLRNKVFWVLDTLKGYRVAKQVKELQRILSSSNWAAIEEYNSLKLNQLLVHASNSVSFYKNMNTTKLSDFPVVNKLILRDRIAEFVSNDFESHDLQIRMTSGSTGTPFSVYQDRNKIIRNTADTIYFADLVGYYPGQRLHYIRFWGERMKKSPTEKWMQNVKDYDVSKLNDEYIRVFLKKIASSGDHGILAYASAYDKIVSFIERKVPKFKASNVSSMIAMSESLSKKTKMKLMSFFDCVVSSRYSNIENGIIAQQLNAGGDFDSFTINWASYHVELLKIDSDEPAEYGELGRIVITDLFNYGMPIIRYDTDDLGVMMVTENGLPVFSSIEGRSLDALTDTSGNWVSSFVPTELEEFKGILEYEFNQTGEKEYQIQLVVNEQYKEELEIVQFIKQYFGTDAHIQIKYVDSIPLLASGKRKKVLNTFKNPTD